MILARIGDPNENIKADILVELITPNKVLQYYASAAKLGKQEAISKACNYCDTISEEAKEEKRLDDIKSLLADFTDLFDGVVSNEVEKTKESLGIRSKTELENVLEEILVTEDEFLNDAKKLLAAFQRFPEVNRDDTMKKIITEINDAIKEIESFKQRINSIVKSDYTEGEKAEHLADLYQSDSFKKYIFALRKMILNEKRISEKDQNNATIWNQYLEQQTKIQSDEKTLLNTNTVNLTKFTQRLAKIPLLLRELNKHKKTPDESPQTDQKEKTPLERAIEFTQTELTKINEEDTTTMYSIISLMRNLGKDRKLAFEKPSKGKKTELLTSAKRGWSKKPSKDSQRVAEYMMTEVQKHIQAIKIQSRATEDQIEILELQDRLQELRSEVRKWRENDWFKDVLDKFPNQKLQYDSLIQEERQTA